MSEFLTNEQIKEFAELGGITKCMESIEKDYAKPQSMSPKYFFPTLEEMGYEKVVQCKHCVKRGDPVMCPMCYNELNDGYWIVHDHTTDYGFCHLGEQEDVFKRKD